VPTLPVNQSLRLAGWLAGKALKALEAKSIVKALDALKAKSIVKAGWLAGWPDPEGP
jgi:hypothetical protein